MRGYGGKGYSARKKSERGIIQKFFVFLMSCTFGASLISYLASIWWGFDLFSNFKLQYTIIALICVLPLLFFKRMGWAAVCLVIILSQGYSLLPLWENIDEPEGAYETVKVLQFNVDKDNDNIEEITRWLVSRSEDVDIVVLQEVNSKWETALRRVQWAYPYYINKEMRDGREMVVFSRLYIDEMEVKTTEDKQPVIVVRGETMGYELPFVVYGIHPPAPVLPSYAERRNELLMYTAKEISQEPAKNKMVIADFNATRFSPWFKDMLEVSGLNDSNIGQGLLSSWPSYAFYNLGLLIDNILVSDSIFVDRKEVGPAMGSDHRPVITSLRLLVPDDKESVISGQ